ncbi:protein-glutamate methylesterase/protein-glutamine glutaminase [Demequina zhanjiangensis]|uniref:Protein-glutamate methylesterase/protein-glutamine glutaminase n=1 Tax=Demequina zhanjiangensis TaxID=3051659 RepID=A0ABT8FZM9_9MICO|nr:chemotaxis response regulator protein-glutamate methylesterase [Demequina sp. SYSU T00b26]MDN4472349.1 chemotaxis response regulator protein-glutamate methylesterase [Demequina sp. SYSU T00b26]
MATIKVLVVDDSVVVRRIVTDALSADNAIEVVGVAQNGSIALSKAAALKPDLITMDIEMPVMNGIETVTELRRRGVRTPIIMFSTLTSHGASSTLDALAAGATDYVTKPTRVADPTEAVGVIKEQLLPKIKALVGRPRMGAPARVAQHDGPVRRPRAVVIGSSTGGPEALSKVVSALPGPLPVPVLVTQHMPPVFTAQLAARLDRIGPSRVVEAKAGDRLEPGTIYIAPGDYHLEVQSQGTLVKAVTHQGPQVNFCRPAVDVMFKSAVKVWGGDLLAVVLTGMGSDGRDACRDIKDAGGRVVVQDEPTSVVWGMPGAVATAGLAHQILPITEIAPAIAGAFTGRTARRVEVAR